MPWTENKHLKYLTNTLKQTDISTALIFLDSSCRLILVSWKGRKYIHISIQTYSLYAYEIKRKLKTDFSKYRRVTKILFIKLTSLILHLSFLFHISSLLWKLISMYFKTVFFLLTEIQIGVHITLESNWKPTIFSRLFQRCVG